MTATITTWGPAAVLLLFALLIGWSPLGPYRRYRQRQRLISDYGLARLDNVILDDGIGGHKVVEHILLTAEGLLVLLPRHCDGALFGGERIESWTQMSGSGKSFHFENPLHQLDELLATLRYHLPGIPLQGRVLFSGRCRFPKGRPERLLLVEELARKEKRVDQAVVPVLNEAWCKLKGQPRAEQSGEAAFPLLSTLRLLAALLALIGAAAWLVWHLR